MPAKILIVDDNDLMRTLLRGILRSEDCEVVGEEKMAPLPSNASSEPVRASFSWTS